MDQVSVAWAAGFFEGEGTSGISRTKRRSGLGGEYRYVRLSAVQVNREPLDKMRALFGGTVTAWNRPRAGSSTVYGWQLVGSRAEQLMKAMLPHLSAKRRSQYEAVLAQVHEHFESSLTAEKIDYTEWRDAVATGTG